MIIIDSGHQQVSKQHVSRGLQAALGVEQLEVFFIVIGDRYFEATWRIFWKMNSLLFS